MSNGEPLPGGTITFVPLSGKGNLASVWINPDGTYELEAPATECKISIDNRNVGKKPAAPVGAGGGGGAPGAGGAPGGKGPGAGAPVGGPGGKGPPGGMPGGPGGKGGKGGPADDKDSIDKRMAELGQAPSVSSGEVQPGTIKPINPKYYDTETSGLTYTVKGGAQTHDIKLDP